MTELVLASPIPQGSRGRNDWFTARWLQIHATLAEPGRTAFYPSHVEITVHSQREGKREPIVLRLSLEDALVLADTLQREVERSVPPRTSGTSGTSGTSVRAVVCPSCGAVDSKWIAAGTADAYCAICGEYWEEPADAPAAP